MRETINRWNDLYSQCIIHKTMVADDSVFCMTTNRISHSPNKIEWETFDDCHLRWISACLHSTKSSCLSIYCNASIDSHTKREKDSVNSSAKAECILNFLKWCDRVEFVICKAVSGIIRTTSKAMRCQWQQKRNEMRNSLTWHGVKNKNGKWWEHWRRGSTETREEKCNERIPLGMSWHRRVCDCRSVENS